MCLFKFCTVSWTNATFKALTVHTVTYGEFKWQGLLLYKWKAAVCGGELHWLTCHNAIPSMPIKLSTRSVHLFQLNHYYFKRDLLFHILLCYCRWNHISTKPQEKKHKDFHLFFSCTSIRMHMIRLKSGQSNVLTAANKGSYELTTRSMCFSHIPMDYLSWLCCQFGRSCIVFVCWHLYLFIGV